MVERVQSLDATYSALSDHTRRTILERLSVKDARVTDVAAGLPMSLTAVSKHIRVLEDAGLAQLHKNLGDCQYRAARYDDALEAYQRAVKINPQLGDDVWLKLGNIRFKRQERDEAVRCWEQALALDPENAIVRTNLDAVRQVL